MIALACVGTVAALLVALVLALASDDSTPSGSDAAVPRLAIPPAAAYAHPRTRYDGGPEEGTRGASVPDAGAYASARRRDPGPVSRTGARRGEPPLPASLAA